MTLISNNHFITDTWQHITNDAEITDYENSIVSLDRLQDAVNSSAKIIGVHVTNTARTDELQPFFSRLSLISIAFPSFSDGRGFSLARNLRNAGFNGEIRATGPLIADQYAYAISCGFTSVDVPEALATRQPETQWKTAMTSLSLSYQRGYTHGSNILDQRRSSSEPSPLRLRETVAKSNG